MQPQSQGSFLWSHIEDQIDCRAIKKQSRHVSLATADYSRTSGSKSRDLTKTSRAAHE